MWTLDATEIRHSYAHRAVLDGVGFKGPVRVLGIAGANGSGKSTLLNILAGLIRPSAGSVAWTAPDGTATDAPSIRTRAGYCSPTLGLYPDLTVRENLVFIAKLRGIGSDVIDDWLQRFDIAHVAGQAVGQCSTGQQQRTRLATAFLHAPDLVFLDEPGSNLDAAGLAIVEAVIREGGRSVVLASNDPAELAWCGETITVGSRQ